MIIPLLAKAAKSTLGYAMNKMGGGANDTPPPSEQKQKPKPQNSKTVNFDILSNWQPAHSDLYNVYFEDDDNLNTMKVNDSSDGKIFPATSVEEHLTQVQYEDIRLIDGLTLPYPVDIQDYGYITVTFQENISWDAHIQLKKWVDNWRNNAEGMFKTPKQQIKTLIIGRLSLTGKVMTVSKYGVLPPDSLRATNTQQNATVDNSVTFRVVTIHKPMYYADEEQTPAEGDNPSKYAEKLFKR